MFFCLPLSAQLAGHGGVVTSIALSPDGKRALSGGFDYSLIVWNTENQALVRRLVGHDAAVTSVALYDRGRRAVSGSDDGTLAIWNLDTGKLVRRLHGHRGKVSSVAVSPDESTVVSGGWDRTVRLWNIKGSRPGRVLRWHSNNVNGVAFSPDGSRILSAGYDGTIRIWDRESGGRLMSIKGPLRHGFNALIPLNDGVTVASASLDETVRLWDLRSGTRLGHFLGHDGPVLSVTISSDGAYLASGGMDGAIRIWRTEGDRSVFRLLEQHGGPVWSLAFSGGRLYSAGGDGLIRVWDVSRGTEVLSGRVEAAATGPAQPDLSDHPGKRLFRKCSACHTTSQSKAFRAGPDLYGLFGRRAGSLASYPYSKALLNSRIVWTEETVNALFDVGPDEYIPGTKMPLQRIPDPADRAMLVDYLKLITRPDQPGE